MAFPLDQLAPQQYGPQAIGLPGGGTQLTTPRFGRQESQIMQNLAQMGAQNLDFGPIEQREQKRFQTDIIPSLAERFTAMGGGQRSSAFQGALGQSSADLGERLAALRAGFGAQQLQFGLQPQFESHLQPSPYQGLTTGIGAALPALAEVGAKYFLGGKGGQNQQQPQQQQQSTGTGQTIANAALGTAGAALPAAAGFFGSGGTLAGLGTAAAAAAPVALPLLAGAAVIGTIAYLLSGD